MRKLHDFEITCVAAQAFCKRETVRKYLRNTEPMWPATKARIAAAMVALGYVTAERAGG